MKGKTYKKRHPRLKKRSTKRRSTMKRKTRGTRRSTLKRCGGARHNTVAVGDVEKTLDELDKEEKQRQLDKARSTGDYNNKTQRLFMLNPIFREIEKEAEAEKKQAALNAAPRPTKKVQVGQAPIPNTFFDYNIPEETIGIGGGSKLRSFTRKLKKCFGMSCMNTSTVAPAAEEMIAYSPPKSSKKSGSSVAPSDVVHAALEEAKSVKRQERKALEEFAQFSESKSRLGLEDSPSREAELKAELAALGTASPPRSRSRTNRTVVSRSAGPMTTKLGKLSLVDIAELKNIQEFPVKELLQYAETYKNQIEDAITIKAIEELMESIKNINTKRRQYAEGTNKRKQFNSMLKNVIESLRTLIATNFIDTHKISA